MTGQREICGGLRIQFSCLPFMSLHCKIGAEVIALNEKQLQEMEQKAYDNGLFVSKLSKADAETAVRKIYAVFKNQGFDYIIINDEGMFRFNGDRLRFAELIADVGELEHGNKYERRLTPYEYDFLRGYVEYGKFALERQSDDIEHPRRTVSRVIVPEDTKAYQRLCRQVIGQEEMKRTLCKLAAVYQFARKREEYSLVSPPIHKVLAFIGPPGTAKTTAARFFAEMMTEEGIIGGSRIAYVTGTQLKAKYVGQTSERVHQIFEGNDIIIIDEAYSLVNYNEAERTDNFSQEALAQLCIEVEDHSDDKLIIFAGYGGKINEKNNKMKKFLSENPGIASRITFTVQFSPYTAEEMLDIFEALAGQATFRLEDGWRELMLPFFEERLKDENFGNGREARRFLEHAMAIAAEKFLRWAAETENNSPYGREREERQRLSILACEDLREALLEFKKEQGWG